MSKNLPYIVAGVALVLLLGTWASSNPGVDLNQFAQAIAKKDVQVLDLSHALNDKIPVIQLPPPLANSPGYKANLISKYDDKGPAWYWNWIEVGEHAGTHLDAPCHWITGKDKACIDKIPVDQLISPAVVIDVTEKAKADSNYLLTKQDVLDWEKKNGKVPEGALVIMKTGWGVMQSEPKKFLGLEADGKPHWPGFSMEVSEFLVKERNVNAIGTEAVGLDSGNAAGFNPPFPAHYVMLGAGKYMLTSLANVDKLPAKGVVVMAVPMKLEGGSGSPVRVLALVPKAGS
jgi:kynurenine formamidase